MFHWVAEQAESDRRSDSLPTLQVGQGIDLFRGRAFLFHVIPNEVRDLAQTRGMFLVISVIKASCVRSFAPLRMTERRVRVLIPRRVWQSFDRNVRARALCP